MQKYYSLEQSGKTADMYIFGDITSYPWDEKDKDAYGIVKELESLDADSINVHINSYGGEGSEGLAIHNTLRNCNCKVTTYCDGFACSAASVIFMAGDERIMNSASLLMIHNAWTYAAGNANDLRKQAEDLDKITQASVKAYMRCASISEEELKRLMDEETWITAEEAMNYGLATGAMEEKEEGISQSAMGYIRKRLLRPEERTEEIKITEDLAEAIADKVMQKAGEFLKKSEQEDSTGWGKFFNESKGE